MNTFGDLKEHIESTISKSKSQEIKTKAFDFVECRIDGRDHLFSTGMTWREIFEIPDETSMNKIISQGENKEEGKFIPFKVEISDGSLILIVKPI